MKIVFTKIVDIRLIKPFKETITLFRSYNAEEMESLCNWIKKYTYRSLEPIAVNDEYQIIDGYQRYNALMKLKSKFIDVRLIAYSTVSEMIEHCIVSNTCRTHLTIEQKQKYVKRLNVLNKVKL